MIPIGYNFPNKTSENICICGNIENMVHIYTCKKLSGEKEEKSFENIYKDCVKNMKIVLKRFESNFEKRQQIKSEENAPHGIPAQVDPLSNCTVMKIN